MHLRAPGASLIFLAYLGVQVGVGLVVGLVAAVGYAILHPGARGNLPLDFIQAIAIGAGLAGMLASGATALGLVRRAVREEASGMQALGWMRGSARMRIAAGFAGVALGIAFLALMARFPLPEGHRPGVMQAAAAAGGWALAAWAALALFAAPPIEEFVFRGMLWTGLSRSWPSWLAGTVVTLVFLALHLPEAGGYLPALAGIGTLGLGALALRAASGSLVPPIVFHAAYNGTLVLAVVAARMAT